VPLCKAKSQAAVAHRIRTEITFGLEGGYDFGGLSMGSAPADEKVHCLAHPTRHGGTSRWPGSPGRFEPPVSERKLAPPGSTRRVHMGIPSLILRDGDDGSLAADAILLQPRE